MHAACDRARQWATAEIDGELSRFEIVLLRAHLDACPSCREFHAAVGGITETLRATPLQRLERAIEVKRLRWRVRSRDSWDRGSRRPLTRLAVRRQGDLSPQVRGEVMGLVM